MIRLVFVSFCFFSLISSSFVDATPENRREAYTDQVAKSLGAEQLREYMFLEAIPEETIFAEDSSIQFSIKSKQKKMFSGVRSELSVNYPFETKQRVSYRFDILVPNNFISDDDNRWYILAQWHDQPNPKLGETWKDFPGRSPITYLYTEKINRNFGIGIRYGDSAHWFPIEYDQWYTLEFDFLWSDDEDGQLKFTVDESDPILFKGKNMHNKYQHYLKIGMYRHPKIQSSNNIKFRALFIN